LKGFSEVVCNHFFGWAEFDGEFFVVYAAGNKIEAYVEMFNPLAAGFLTILLEEYSTLVIFLVEKGALVTVSLRVQEIIGP
jgi:hypothetical protein